MRACRFHWRNGCAAVTAGVAFAGLASTAVAQNGPPVANRPAAAASSPAPSGNQGSLLPAFPGFGTQQADPNSPAWTITPTAELDVIATDNATYAVDHTKADMLAWLTAGVTVTGDTPRAQVLLSYSASVSRGVSVATNTLLTQNGAGLAHTILIPDALFLDLRGNAGQFAQNGFIQSNLALLDRNNSLQTYTLSVTPTFQTPVGDVGIFSATYDDSHVWYSNHADGTSNPLTNLGLISDGEQQTASAQFDMPGTFTARMRNVFVVTDTRANTESGIGSFRRSFGTLINQYQITRSVGAIASAGYERISSDQSAFHNEGGTWNVGVQWVPDPDSSFLLLYGRNDFSTDVSGRVQWLVSPLTSFYASYTDSIGNAQSFLIANNQGLNFSGFGGIPNLPISLGGFAPAVGVTFQDSPTISVLGVGGGAGLGAGGGLGSGVGLGVGVPLTGVNNLGLSQDGLFRSRELVGTVSYNLSVQSLSLTAAHSEQTFLAIAGGRIKSNAVLLNWTRAFPDNLTGNANLGYQSSNYGTAYNIGVAASYELSRSITGTARYDFISQGYDGISQRLTVNAITISLRKTFE